MADYREIRADYDRDSIVVYQAYRPEIADAALKAGRFVAPFSFGRMTWIKPSFLWLMERSNWARKSGQERILAVRIKKRCWEVALREAVLTCFEPTMNRSIEEWREQFGKCRVHVQWDPERSIHGKKLEHRSIQVGVGRQLIREYVEDWTLELTDLTPIADKIRRLCELGHADRGKKLLPKERRYEVSAEVAARLAMNAG